MLVNYDSVRDIVARNLRPQIEAPPVPDALLTKDGVIIKHRCPQFDVFEQPWAKTTEAAPVISALFVEDPDSRYCQYMAMGPMHELEYSKFRQCFIAAIAPYHNHWTVQLTLAAL